MDKKSVAKNYRFLAILLSCMVAGALLGWFRPKWGHNIAFLGTVFINMMFCVVVPLVFASIAGSVANMESRQRAAPVLSSEPAIQEVQHTGDIPGHRIAAPLRIERSAVIH